MSAITAACHNIRYLLSIYALEEDPEGVKGEKGVELKKLLREYDDKHHPVCGAANRVSFALISNICIKNYFTNFNQ